MLCFVLNRHTGDWLFASNCVHITETECDLTSVLSPNRNYSAKVETESTDLSFNNDNLPSTRSQYFNPYRQSEITAVSFSLEAHGANGSVVLHITDPLTSIYQDQRLLTIRDVFQKDLMYKISYQKVGSTRKKEAVRGSNVAVVGDLKPQQSYCFSVAAFIPSRDPHSQLGAWSQQQCSPASRTFLQELSVEALVGGSLILLLLLLIIIITSVLCCRRHRRRHHNTAQTLPTA